MQAAASERSLANDEPSLWPLLSQRLQAYSAAGLTALTGDGGGGGGAWRALWLRSRDARNNLAPRCACERRG